MATDHETLGLVGDDLPPDHRSGYVALVGKPNVGKSTLLNLWAGQKVAIVSEKPQTTRQRILAIVTRPEAQIVFVDTPGIHEPQHKLGELMVETANRAVLDADVVLFVVDASRPPSTEDIRIAELIHLKARGPVILALNKMDSLTGELLEARSAEYSGLLEPTLEMPISATEATNCNELLEAIITRLPPGPRYYPAEQVTDQEERLIVAELIREQILQRLYQEVPYSVAVVVEEFKEREAQDLIYISANVFVEKDSQKGIIIGSGGRQLRSIGQAARQEIERFLGCSVYLDLWVKVKKKWRKDEAELRRLGFTPPGS